MTAPVFTNNASTTLAANTTTSATTITVTDASIFNTLIQNGAGATNGVHEVATLSDGTNREIVQVTNAATGTNIITVVREQEGTAGYAFLTGDDIKLDITAAVLNGGFFDRAPNDYSIILGTSSVDLTTLRSTVNHGASGSRSIAVGSSCEATAADTIAMGYTAIANTDGNVAIGKDAEAKEQGCVALGASARAIDLSTTDARNTAIGAHASALESYGTAIGNSASLGIDSVRATAVGFNAGSDVEASYHVAIGAEAKASNEYAVSIGYYAEDRIAKTHHITGPSIIRKDNAETDEVLYFSGQENIIFSQEVSFLATGTNVVSLTVPTGSSFFVDEVGIVLTSTNTVSVSPEISFGDSGTSDLLLAATVTTGTNNKDRDKYTADSTVSINTPDGLTSLTMSIITVATATTCLGRVYFKGMLLEDE